MPLQDILTELFCPPVCRRNSGSFDVSARVHENHSLNHLLLLYANYTTNSRYFKFFPSAGLQVDNPLKSVDRHVALTEN